VNAGKTCKFDTCVVNTVTKTTAAGDCSFHPPTTVDEDRIQRMITDGDAPEPPTAAADTELYVPLPQAYSMQLRKKDAARKKIQDAVGEFDLASDVRYMSDSSDDYLPEQRERCGVRDCKEDIFLGC